MGKLIDADELRNHWLYDTFGNEPEFTPNDVLDSIDEMPAIDAVPVIRCKDCKHWAVSACDPDAHYCKRIDPEDGPEGIDFLECDFCSYGEPVEKPVESVDK